MKYNQSRPGLELVSPCPFTTTITITSRAPITNYGCCNWNNPQMIGKGTVSKRINNEHPNFSIIKIVRNPEYSPRLVETCIHSNSSQKSSANAGLQNSQRSKQKKIIIGIHTWDGHLVRYSGPFLKWITNELKQMDQRTRKLMTMHKALHPRDDVDRLYVSRNKGGRGLASIENSIDAWRQRLKHYIKNTKVDWLQPLETILITRWTTEWQ